MSLRAYESAKEQIEGWAEIWRKDGESDERMTERIGNLTHPSGEQQILAADDLWAITKNVVCPLP